jgi:hypothetical protein
MNAAKIVIPVAVGAAIIGGAVVSVPRENRHVEWPIMGTITGIAAIVSVLLLRKSGFKPPALINDIPGGNAQIIPFPRAA